MLVLLACATADKPADSRPEAGDLDSAGETAAPDDSGGPDDSGSPETGSPGETAAPDTGPSGDSASPDTGNTDDTGAPDDTGSPEPDPVVRTGLLDVEDAVAAHVGARAGDYAGIAVARAGDWDGDGADDLVIGAFLADTRATDAGGVYVATAATGGSLSGALASADGPHADANLGEAVAAPGDLTGDGHGDLVAAAPSTIVAAEFAPGTVVLYDGATGGTLDAHTTWEGVGNYEGLGTALASPGDLTGDGAPDLAIGASTHGYLEGTNTGALYLVHAAPGGDVPVTDAAWTLTGGTSDRAGAALADVGDADGDGLADLLVGSHGTGTTAGWLLTGGYTDAPLDDLAELRIAPVGATDAAGTAVASAGDVDGDGHVDLLVGGYAEATGGTCAGAAWLLTGAPRGDVSLADASAKVVGEAAYAFTGLSVASLWDQDGDGHDDVVVGARQDAEGGANAGAVFVFPGSTRGTVDTSAYLTKIVGPPGALVGQRVGDAGDLTGDGRAELYVSGTGADGARGTVWIVDLLAE